MDSERMDLARITEMLRRLDIEASRYTGVIPDDIGEAIIAAVTTTAMAAAAATCRDDITAMMRLVTSLSKQLYRAGYVSGAEDTAARLNPAKRR